ncbi:MAG: hypothetical protein IT215_07370 [Chitinophagaceae bacterium]|nr:hypothetical protein [Chitinophagaceae bacterium]
MDRKINHFRNLIHYACVDDNLHEREREYIYQVGERLGIDKSVIESELISKQSSIHPLPSDEVSCFILLNDILNVITADSVINNEEESECKQIATELGFDQDVVTVLLNKLKNHLEGGFTENRTSSFIKNEIYNLTSKNYLDAKYN